MSVWMRPLTATLVAAVLAASCSSPPPTSGAGAADPVVTPEPTATPVPLTLDEVAVAFVEAWEREDWDVLSTLVFDPADRPADEHRDTWAALEVLETRIDAQPLVVDGPRATLPIRVELELDRLGSWGYDTVIGLVLVNDRWSVEWGRHTIHPGLVDGRRLDRRRVWPQRGEIRAWDGEPLRTLRPVVRIGLEPRRIEDRDLLLETLADLIDIDPEQVAEDLDADGVQPDWFVPIATMRAEEFPAVSLQVEPLPGVVIRQDLDRLAPTDDFARQVLGTVGSITAEQLAEFGEPYDSSRIVGRSGLELVYEETLAGLPFGDIRLVDAGGQLVSVLATFDGRDAVDLVTTLDLGAQTAAEAALDGAAEPAALVAIDIPSGGVRAVVSRPTDEFGRALSGAYPPGSTFKTVTAAAFLAAGNTAETTVSCPAEVFVGGLRFTNAGGSSLGNVSLQTAYAASCNTAFVNVGSALDPGALDAAAGRFGFGLDYSVGLNTGGGNLPVPADDAEYGASSIGQGRVTASPLHMASVAAAVAAGEWREPVLILEPERQRRFEPSVLDPDVASALRAMMRQVVTSGTGTAAASAGADISGKTGSAEFGDEDPPRTHAWFIGYREDMAVAVLVEGGGAGGAVAAPIAAEFFRLLDAGDGQG